MSLASRQAPEAFGVSRLVSFSDPEIEQMPNPFGVPLHTAALAIRAYNSVVPPEQISHAESRIALLHPHEVSLAMLHTVNVLKNNTPRDRLGRITKEDAEDTAEEAARLFGETRDQIRSVMRSFFAKRAEVITPGCFNNLSLVAGADGVQRIMLLPHAEAQDSALDSMRQERQACLNILKRQLGFRSVEPVDVGQVIAELPDSTVYTEDLRVFMAAQSTLLSLQEQANKLCLNRSLADLVAHKAELYQAGPLNFTYPKINVRKAPPANFDTEAEGGPVEPLAKPGTRIRIDMKTGERSVVPINYDEAEEGYTTLIPIPRSDSPLFTEANPNN